MDIIDVVCFWFLQISLIRIIQCFFFRSSSPFPIALYIYYFNIYYISLIYIGIRTIYIYLVTSNFFLNWYKIMIFTCFIFHALLINVISYNFHQMIPSKSSFLLLFSSFVCVFIYLFGWLMIGPCHFVLSGWSSDLWCFWKVHAHIKFPFFFFLLLFYSNEFSGNKLSNIYKCVQKQSSFVWKVQRKFQNSIWSKWTWMIHTFMYLWLFIWIDGNSCGDNGIKYTTYIKIWYANGISIPTSSII